MPNFFKYIVTILSVTFTCLVHSSQAQNAGDPDASFGDGGTVVTQLGDGNERSAGLVIQPDQKVVISGWAKVNNEYKATLVRLNPDGSYDNSFSSDGVAYSVPKFESYTNQSRPLIIQPDGKLVHVGNTGTFGSYNFLITRFNSDGSPDTGFDADGSVEYSVLSGDDYTNAVALQTDGKIIVVGTGNTSGNFYRMAAARFNSDGSIDNTFNGSGTFTLDLGDSDDYIKDVIVLPDGKIMLLCESSFSNTEKDLVMIRLNADGTYDTSFDSDGMVIVPVTNGTDYIGSFARQGDGKFIVAGTAEDGNYFDVFVLRVEEDGTLDASFGSNGITITHQTDWDDWGESVTLAADGTIYIGGYHGNTTQVEGALVLCYTQDGELDPAFGDNGYSNIETYSYRVENIALQADQKILISGWYSSGTSNGYEFAATRLLSEENVGIVDLPQQTSLKIFPNPSIGVFSIDIPGAAMSESELTVFDRTGITVFRSHDPEQATFDLDLPSGTYFVKYKTPTQIATEPLIISK